MQEKINVFIQNKVWVFFPFKHTSHEIKYAAMELMYTQPQTVKKSISLFLKWFSETESKVQLLAQKHIVYLCYKLELSFCSWLYMDWSATVFSRVLCRQQDLPLHKFTELESKM